MAKEVKSVRSFGFRLFNIGGRNKKKTRIVVISIIIVLLIMAYKIIGSANVKNKTTMFLETKGYVTNDIENIKVEHSFFNGFLSYDEWSISIAFVSEPNVTYSFTYKNKEIIFRGIYDSTKEKEELKELEDKFNNGGLHNSNQ